MLDRYERSIKLACLLLALVFLAQLAGVVLRGNPLSNLKIPALPTLPGGTNEPAQLAQNATNAPAKMAGTKATNTVMATNELTGTNRANGTNAGVKGTNGMAVGETGPKHGGARGARMPPGMMGGPNGGGRKKEELPPEVQARVDKIIESEILGPAPHPMPMMLQGIAEDQAFIQATNGQSGPVKVGGEMGGIKLLRIGVNRVLVEQNGEKKELTIFNGMGGESLLPPPTNAPGTNTASTNAPFTNGPAQKGVVKLASAHDLSTNQNTSVKQKETK